ncbi:transglutaminase-like cysteine peptidase [Microvirga sp. BT689]|uniref:transglutaminase-like cysteine peptidase n=1 Tax=Microvirga arvi TaxID=2778731 RepID=UPI0019515CB1|nr:transglutaminase-like cysteine peptidase [Microvirga arvi]MBM6583978.1 transglutaminase-like cysteine peptidase [Microvirga arvi]
MADALLAPVCIGEESAPIAVMIVRTGRSNFILDNKRNAVLPWRRTGYIYLQREVGTGLTWVSLGRVFTPPVATADR